MGGIKGGIISSSNNGGRIITPQQSIYRAHGADQVMTKCFSSGMDDDNINSPDDANDDDDVDEDKFNIEDLRQRMAQQQQNEDSSGDDDDDGTEFDTNNNDDMLDANVELFNEDGDNDINKPEDVYIIVYNPDTDDQGVHTLEVPKGSGSNFILAFESEMECYRFCALLKEQQFFDPKVQEIKFASLEDHCESLPGVSVQPIPKGMNLKPPTERVDELDLNPNRDIEVDFVDYLYRMSSSSSTGGDGDDDESSGDGGALTDNDNGGGGSWEWMDYCFNGMVANQHIYLHGFHICIALSRHIEHTDTLVVNCVRQDADIMVTSTVCKAMSNHFWTITPDG